MPRPATVYAVYKYPDLAAPLGCNGADDYRKIVICDAVTFEVAEETVSAKNYREFLMEVEQSRGKFYRTPIRGYRLV